MKQLIVAVLLMASTAGCTNALSFAPPVVDHGHLKAGSTQAGALELLGRYEAHYQSAIEKNANGRQIFELPALVAVIGGIAATAFGGGTDGALVAATSSATFRSGNSYYAPKAKATIYIDAVNALHCVRRATTSSSAANILTALPGAVGQEIIFDEVNAGLAAISTTAASRLVNAGSVSEAAGIAAQLESSLKREDAAKATGGAVMARMVGIAAVPNPLTAEEIAALRAGFQEPVTRCALSAKAAS